MKYTRSLILVPNLHVGKHVFQRWALHSNAFFGHPPFSYKINIFKFPLIQSHIMFYRVLSYSTCKSLISLPHMHYHIKLRCFIIYKWWTIFILNSCSLLLVTIWYGVSRHYHGNLKEIYHSYLSTSMENLKSHMHGFNHWSI